MLNRLAWILTLQMTVVSVYCQQKNFVYDRVSSFKEGMAMVHIGQKAGFIDQAGKEVVSPIYEDGYKTGQFNNGLARVKLNGLYGMIDKTGKLVLPCEYRSLEEFSEGLAAANHKTRGYEFINEKGKVAFATKYYLPSVLGGVKFVNGLIPVNDESEKFGYMDKTGKLVLPFEYDFGDLFTADGFAVIQKSFDNPKMNLINTSGKELLPAKYDNITPFIDGLAGVNIGAKADASYNLVGGKWGLINTSGIEVRSCLFDKIGDFKGGYAIVESGQRPKARKGVVSKNGTQVMPIVYGAVFLLKTGILAARTSTSPFALFDYNGKRLTPFSLNVQSFEMAENCFSVAQVNEQDNTIGKTGVMDNTGKLIIPYNYDRIANFSEGLAIVTIDDKYGAIDKTGKLVIPVQYDFIGQFNEGWAQVVMNRKHGFISKTGILMNIKRK